MRLVDDYLALRRALGFKLRAVESRLRAVSVHARYGSRDGGVLPESLAA